MNRTDKIELAIWRFLAKYDNENTTLSTAALISDCVKEIEKRLDE